MHGPTGSSGVQRFPKSGHSVGETLPMMTLPHRQPGGSDVSFPLARPASNSENSGRSA
jgi:hypothetical protein